MSNPPAKESPSSFLPRAAPPFPSRDPRSRRTSPRALAENFHPMFLSPHMPRAKGRICIRSCPERQGRRRGNRGPVPGRFAALWGPQRAPCDPPPGRAGALGAVGFARQPPDDQMSAYTRGSTSASDDAPLERFLAERVPDFEPRASQPGYVVEARGGPFRIVQLCSPQQASRSRQGFGSPPSSALVPLIRINRFPRPRWGLRVCSAPSPVAEHIRGVPEADTVMIDRVRTMRVQAGRC